jgi:hypothetical protein
MDIAYDKPLAKNSAALLREAGYMPIFDRLSGKQSFVNKIRGDRYPRFHVYVLEETEGQLKLHLHLDHKEHGWGDRLHDSEYDGPDVKEEAGRLLRWMAHHTQHAVAKGDGEKKGFWANFFGN